MKQIRKSNYQNTFRASWIGDISCWRINIWRSDGNGELTSIKLKAQEQREIVLHFIMSQGVLRDDRRWMLKKSQIRIVLSNYPVHEIIVLDDIKGL